MTMIDERSLEQLLARAAQEIEVPVDGAARIAAAAERLERRTFRAASPVVEVGDEGHDRTERTSALSRSHRMAAVAASVVVAALIAVATLGHFGSSESPSSRAAHSAVAGAAAPVNASGNGAVQGAAKASRPAVTPNGGLVYGSVPPRTRPATGDVAGTKIESIGSMNLTVPHLDAAVSALTTAVSGDGGYVAAEQTQSASPGVPASGTVTLQVPQTSFSTLVDQVKRLGVSSAVSTKQVDVTGQYVDLQAQITALQATQQQYLTIMTKAQSIGDILAVQQQLNSVNSQLQQVEGESHLLDKQTTYGTLTVDLTEPSPKPALAPRAAPKPPTGLAAAWGSARHGFADGVYWVVRQTGGLAFLVLLAGLLYLLGRIGWRGLRRVAL